ncbi:MAG: CBS domain-containing protein [Halanaeroarchaeum sp.]
MDISDIVTDEYETVDVDDTVAALQGIFDDSSTRAVVVLDGDEYEGLLTRRRLARSHVVPDATVGRYVWHVARVGRHDDVRSVAGRMVGSQSHVLPVVEGDDLLGLVTAEAILETVAPFLDVLDVSDVASHDLTTIGPSDSIGRALNVFREQGIGHLPVVERRPPHGPPGERERATAEDDLVGIVSLHDVLGFSVREMHRAAGGDPGSFGDDASGGGTGSHGGFGERSGDVDRVLDLPVENVMTAVPFTTTDDASLADAVTRMLERDIASLVVVEDGVPVGIVTWTDVLEVLTLTGEERLPVQITNVDLLDDITREGVADLIEGVAEKYGRMRVLEANVHLHEHDETLRGVSLVMARIRLFTDRGHFVGTGEGYGAAHALRLAANVLEREILEGKEYARSKKHPEPEEISKLYGWVLSD